MKTALYRIWGNDDQLLYVGISKSALGRLGQHLTEKSWAADIANVTIETFATRELAAAAEVEAIKAEKPLHNVVHNGSSAYVGRPNPALEKAVTDSAADLSKTKGLKKGHHVGQLPYTLYTLISTDQLFPQPQIPTIEKGVMMLVWNNDEKPKEKEVVFFDGKYFVCKDNCGSYFRVKNAKPIPQIPEYTIEQLKEIVGHEFKIKQ